MMAPGAPVPISRQAELLGLSRASVYYRSRKRALPADDGVIETVGRMIRQNPYMGSRAIQRRLREFGVHIGRARILRIMRYLSL